MCSDRKRIKCINKYRNKNYCTITMRHNLLSKTKYYVANEACVRRKF